MLCIKTIELLFWSITQELFGHLKCSCYFWVSWTIYFKTHIYYFSEKFDNFEIEHKTCLFLVGVQYSLTVLLKSEYIVVMNAPSWIWYISSTNSWIKTLRSNRPTTEYQRYNKTFEKLTFLILILRETLLRSERMYLNCYWLIHYWNTPWEVSLFLVYPEGNHIF